MTMGLIRAFIMKRLCIKMVAIIYLLLFVQCTNRDKVSDDIEALKQQLESTTETTQAI
jgi:hypothetical protein